MPDNNMTIEMTAITKLLKSYQDLQKTKDRVEMALHNAKTLKRDIVFEDHVSNDPGAHDRMGASSITIDKVIRDLEYAKTTLIKGGVK